MTLAFAISRDYAIPISEFEVTYARSGGPGGQNVNKVNSKAVVRWPVQSTPSLPEDLRNRFCLQYKNRITNDGDLIIVGQRFRDQGKNVEDCFAKLIEMFDLVVNPPPPRKPTRVSRTQKTKRLDSKKMHSERKQQRRRSSDD